MPKYTTGEIANLCNVSVRTVQYYDNRGILSPSELSDGGRRIYSQSDLEKMKVICYLRELGFSIENVKTLFQAENSEKVIMLLLEEQEKAVNAELFKTQTTLKRIVELKQAIAKTEHFSLENIGAVTKVMENKRKLKKLRLIMLLTGIPVEILQWAGILLWVFTGKWWLAAVWLGVAICYGFWVTVYYFNKVAYICPECHTTFKPKFKQAFFARHTPKTRKLTCENCHYNGFCVEVYQEEEK